MKTIRIVPAVVGCLILWSSCSHQLAPVGHFQDTPVIADGNTDDWSLPLRFSNPQYTFQYSVTNDKKNVYVCILSKDEAMQLKMLRYGINIYFDPKGDKTKNKKLEFPVKKPEQSSNNNYNNNGNPTTYTGTKITEDQLLLQSDYYNTKGFANIENGQFSVGDQKNSIQIALKLHDDSTLVYEAIIPINDIPGVNQYARSTGKNFDIGISVNAAQNRNNNNNSPRPSYGMRGMRMGGGGYRGGPQQNQQPKEEVNWYEFRLAFSNKQ